MFELVLPWREWSLWCPELFRGDFLKLYVRSRFDVGDISDLLQALLPELSITLSGQVLWKG